MNTSNHSKNMTSGADATSASKKDACVELLPPSFTVRVGNRRLTMSWRPRKPVPGLLTGLLRRSWRAMFGNSLRISMAAAAICAAWNAPAMAAGSIADNALPAGWSIVNGNATFTQTGNTLSINQSTPQAIANFTSFNIGKDATVDITQINSAANFLARVNTGTDPSLIYGALKATGGLTLINQNGIMIGPNGKIDVARFIASTLDISNNDFLAGRMTFVTGNATGTVENQGRIQSATGGSVYLIGANVINGGVINSPNGEILLAAGQTVQLVDTATPGVSVNVTGITGSVTNLGTITAEAGRIGIAAGLINNSGNINASSVVSEGGRIFLRASQNLTTTASSNIEANGATKGGSVVLYSDKVAYIDGNVSATGAPGQGGYVDTSGLKSLDVVNAPTIGAGGTWLIDPYDLEVVSDAVANASISVGGSGPFAVTSTGGSAKIRASSISTWLSQDLNVTLATTGTQSDGGNGNITINAAITKSAGSYSVLTLNADGNIYVNANVTSTSGGLDVNMISNYRGLYNGIQSNQISGATVSLNGGVLNISDGYSGFRSGNLSLVNGAVLNLSYNTSDPNATRAGAVATGNLTVDATSSIIGSGGPNSNLTVNGAYTNNGTLTLLDTAAMNVGTFTNNGNATLTNVTAFSSGGVSNSGNLTLSNASFNVSDSLHNTGTVNLTKSTVWTQHGFYNDAGGTIAANYLASFLVGQVYNNGTMSLDSTANKPNGYTGDTTITVGGGLTNNGTLRVLGTVALSSGDLNNNAGGTLSGTGTINLSSGSLNNSGTIAPGGDGTVGTLAINGTYHQNADGTLLLDVAGDNNYDHLNVDPNSFIYLNGTVKTRLLGGYVPTLGQSFQPFGTSTSVSGIVRHVFGDVVNVSGNLQMLKSFTTDSGIFLTMSGSENITFNGGEGGWGAISSWSSSYFPTAVDNVAIAANTVLQHIASDGTDIVNSIAMSGSGATLNINGGNLSVNMLTSNGTVNVNGGNLGILGASRLRQLNVSSGTVTGGAGSSLNVAEDFQQSGGTLTLADAALNQSTGDLAVGNITANNLVLESENGALTQNVSTALHVKQQLITSTATGATLTNSGNQIAAFAANNRLSGNITLVNTLNTSDTTAVALNGISNTGGNVSVTNTGASLTRAIGSSADFLGGIPTVAASSAAAKLAILGIDTAGGIKSTGKLSVVAHSPLTIGSGGVTAGSDITLTAGNTGSPLDNLTVNGLVTSAGGNINLFAGNNMFINANIATSAPGNALFTVVNGVIAYAPGISITDASGIRIPVAAAVPGIVTPVAANTTEPVSATVINAINSITTPGPLPLPVLSTTSPATKEIMTTGGEAGSFGGDDSEATKEQGKPADASKKVVKLYCS